MLNLWGRVNSINVQKVLWVLDILGLAYQREEAGLQFTANKSADYLAKNPNGRVPLLEDEGYQIWESHSICRYLCNKRQPSSLGAEAAERLYPADAQRRGHVDQWLDWTLWGISAPMVVVFQQRVRLAPEQQDPARIAKAEEESRGHLAVADQNLRRSAFLAGDVLTLADIGLAPTVYRAQALNLITPELPGVQQWMGRLQAEPGFKKWVNVPLT
jgi:glutathione S-transferase